MKKDKLNIVKTALLSRLTDFQLHSNDDEFFNECENLRQFIVDYFNGDLPKDTCDRVVVMSFYADIIKKVKI